MNTPHGIRRGLLERETGIEPVRDFLKKRIYLRNLGLFCEQIGLFRVPAACSRRFPGIAGKKSKINSFLCSGFLDNDISIVVPLHFQCKIRKPDRALFSLIINEGRGHCIQHVVHIVGDGFFIRDFPHIFGSGINLTLARGIRAGTRASAASRSSFVFPFLRQALIVANLDDLTAKSTYSRHVASSQTSSLNCPECCGLPSSWTKYRCFPAVSCTAFRHTRLRVHLPAPDTHLRQPLHHPNTLQTSRR